MTLSVIGAGFGRTGTMSLKMALEKLGIGPCHHMTEIIPTDTKRVALWVDADAGRPDWSKIFDGFVATVDWPSAAFVPELAAAFPEAKVILSSRTAESWSNSFQTTILKILTTPGFFPENMTGWKDMASSIILDRSLRGATDEAGLIKAFEAHEAKVRETVASERLIVHRAGDGWAPLCEFLGKPIPDEDYPRSNNMEDFFKATDEDIKEIGGPN